MICFTVLDSNDLKYNKFEKDWDISDNHSNEFGIKCYNIFDKLANLSDICLSYFRTRYDASDSYKWWIFGISEHRL